MNNYNRAAQFKLAHSLSSGGYLALIGSKFQSIHIQELWFNIRVYDFIALSMCFRTRQISR